MNRTFVLATLAFLCTVTVSPSVLGQDENDTASAVLEPQEMVDFLDQNVGYEHREYYLKLKHGIKIPKQHLNRLQNYIVKLMENTKWHLKDHQENEDN